ncbi:hypothetical protein ACQ4PT_047269 [Festuca glaucescens]
MSPANMVPSVKILAVKVRFGIRKEAKMLPTFLRCFPGVETLHVMSDEADEPSGKCNLKFWQEVAPIDCLEARVKKVVFSQFRGKRMELAFLRFVLERAQILENLVVVLANGDTATEDDETCTKLKAFATAKRASECPPTVVIVAREGDSAWCFHRASDFQQVTPLMVEQPSFMFQHPHEYHDSWLFQKLWHMLCIDRVLADTVTIFHELTEPSATI